MEYSSVNPADTKKRSGWVGASLDKEFIIPHADGAGQIVEIGQAVDKSFLNKKVWMFGGKKEAQFGTCAEYFSTTLENVFELPEETSSLVASCLGVPVATAYYSVFSDNNPENQIFFITGGAGSVSHYAIQFAKLSGAKVITTVSSDIKKEICKSYEEGDLRKPGTKEKDVEFALKDIAVLESLVPISKKADNNKVKKSLIDILEQKRQFSDERVEYRNAKQR